MPFTLAEARVQLKQEEVSFDDALVTSLVKAAGKLAENKTNRSFMQSAWLWSGANFPDCDLNGFFTLRPGPLVSVASVKYYPADGGAQVVMVVGTDYEVDTRSTPGKIRFLTVPSVDDRIDAVEIVFTAGYGAAGANEAAQQAVMPADAVAWMKLQLGTLYKFRETHVQGQPLYNINTFCDGLIYPYIL